MHCRCCRRNGRAYRFTIRRPPRSYKRAVQCPRCSSTDLLDYEPIYQRAQKDRGPMCDCNAVPHPHRLNPDGTGTHRMCARHPLAWPPLSEEQETAWMAVLANPRRTADR